MWEIHGLPLHALVVHVAVVFGPLAALAGLAYAVPSLRDRARWPLVATVVIAVVAVWVAYLSGEHLADVNKYGGPLQKLLEKHENRAGVLRIVMSAYAVVSIVAAWQHARAGATRLVLGALVVVLAVLVLVYVTLTGDAGAQIAWYGIKS
jgi:uncharacterized membrane protein